MNVNHTIPYENLVLQLKISFIQLKHELRKYANDIDNKWKKKKKNQSYEHIGVFKASYHPQPEVENKSKPFLASINSALYDSISLNHLK